MDNEFYPTPEPLIRRMWEMIPHKEMQELHFILEPSAGRGDIIDFIKEDRRRFNRYEYHAIEKDPSLCAILRNKDVPVIDYDFLGYSGYDKYDLIIMNPPFSNGDMHLLKAIDIMYSGHIVCLLNAETLKNPYSATRKSLVQKLNELNAEIEYIQDAFKDAERKTEVEIALVYINITRKIEQDMFDGTKTTKKQFIVEADVNDNALISNNRIEAIVQEYNHVVETVTKTLFDFYKNREDVKEFIDVVVHGTENPTKSALIDSKDLTQHVQGKLNTALRNIRITYWRKVLTLDKVESRMTKKKLDEFNVQLQKNAMMDFTEFNIRTFILNLINSYEDIMMESVLTLFDKLTISHAYGEDLHTKNIHYFNGWKTNKAFRVNKKVIIPMPYGSFADSYDKNKWKLSWSWDLKWIMSDFDKVCNFFDGRSDYVKLYDAISNAFENGQYGKIESTYFIATCHKKGTMHLTFKDDDILRRFNVTACKGKGWLPQNYGQKPYDDLGPVSRDIVDSFEGKKSYELNIKPESSLFYKNSFLRIAA